MLINITNFSPLSLFLLMILWVLRSRNAYEYHQLFSSLSLLPDGFMSLAEPLLSPLSLLPNAYKYHQFFSSHSLDNHGLVISSCWTVMPRDMASRYKHNSVPVNIHNLGSCLLSYRDLYLFSYRVVGMYSDINCCSCLLFPTAPAPHTRCIGGQVARFARPFESRPVDPVRREYYKQLAASCGSSSTSGWVTPTGTLPVSPPPLAKGTEEASGPVPRPKGRRWQKC